MNCPACSATLSAEADRCPACGAAVAPRTEGALAPDLGKLPPRSRRERALEPPAFRKREPAWKDEVRERLKQRKRPAAGDSAELPLFPEPSAAGDGPTADPARPNAAVAEPSRTFSEAYVRVEPEPRFGGQLESEIASAPPAARVDRATFEDFQAAEPTREDTALDPDPPEVVDLPLRPIEVEQPKAAVAEEPVAPPSGPRILDVAERGLGTLEARWSADVADEPSSPEESSPEPVERPAQLLERAQAASLDALAVGAVAAVVVYFAARAARVPLSGLLPAWPYIAGFLVLFSLVYASFFTGLTGQTLGKMLFRLRVVDRAGAPPGHGRAALRALLGTIGSVALVGIAPALMDPARRALHDRLLPDPRHPHLSKSLALDALLAELRPALVGRHLRRPRLLGADGLVFELSGQGSLRLVVDAARSTAGLYLLTKPEGLTIEGLRTQEGAGPAQHALLLFRKHVDGVRVSGLLRHAGDRHLVIECAGAVLSLRMWGAPALTLVVGERALATLGPGRPAWPLPPPLAAPRDDLRGDAPPPALHLARPLAELLDRDLAGADPPRIATEDAGSHSVSLASWREAFAKLLELLARGEAFTAARRERLAAARRELKRQSALCAHLLADLSGLADPDRLRRQAEALLAAPQAVPPGVASCPVPDPYRPGEALLVTLDPALDAMANADRLFAKARRSSRAREQIEARLADARAALHATQGLVERAEAARNLHDLEAPATRPRASAGSAAGGRRAHHYLTTRGLSIHVGRDAKDNHRLTFGFARAEDLWLHASDVPGAHVVLRDNEGRASPEDMREAAEVAAFFSEAKGAAAVDVHVARRKHLRPAKGGAGRVRVSHSETFRVSPKDPEGRLRRRS